MRHSNIRLGMTTYTDPRLLDIAAAIESLPSFDGATSIAPIAAPNPQKVGKPGSIADHCGEFADDCKFRRGTKKPRESRGILDAAERTRTSTGLTPTRPST